MNAVCPRGAEAAHLFGKEEVMGPIPIVGSIIGLKLDGKRASPPPTIRGDATLTYGGIRDG